MSIVAKIENSLAQRWTQLHNKKGTLLSNCEKYAQWTLPYVFPPENAKDMDLPIEVDSIGAQGVNHLSNKIVSTLFPSKSLFFRLAVDQTAKDAIEAAMNLSEQTPDPETTRAMMQAAILEAEKMLAAAEKRAEEHLDMVKYRPEAINAVKHLIVTGNALVYHPEDGRPVQVYSVRDYHVVRDCNGTVVEIMTREKKAFETFTPAVQERLRQDNVIKAAQAKTRNEVRAYNADTEVTIYTQILMQDDGRFLVTQDANDTKLPTRVLYPEKDLRWIPLTWNLVKGEDYGRGLVADYAGAFHSLMVLNNALLNIAAIMGDIKILVDPSSQVDPIELQNSPPGSYHQGKWQEIGTMQFNKLQEANFIFQMIERYQRQIAQAFMLTQQLRRDAERVTAEEIRTDVDELETSNSGVYSRLAADWQTRTAYLALQDTDFQGIGDGIEPRVITGMDSLSRAGEAYNMRLFLTDLGLINTVPEDIRATIKKPQFMQQIAQYHQVPYEAWVMTQAEIAQQQAQQQQMLMAQQQQEADGQAQVEAVKGAANAASQ